MKRRELVSKSGIAALAGLALRGAARAQSRGSNAIEGVWRIVVTTGAGAPPGIPAQFESLITYAAGGTLLEANGVFAPAHGIWEYAGGNVFDATWTRILYDAQGQVSGTNKQRVRARVISENEYEHETRAEIYNTAGQLLRSWPATARGHRVVLDPLP
jgi:hypothetical protein